MQNNFIGRILFLFVISLFFMINIMPIINSDIIEKSNLVHLKEYENTDFNKDRNYCFVIIANDAFYEYDGTWDLQELADWHNENDTISAYVISLSDIYLNSTFWVNGKWGDGNPDNPFKRNDEDEITNYDLFNDSQAKIRNYLRYAYTDLNVRYALLVGDADDSNPLFPIRECFSRGDGAPLEPVRAQYELIPTDMYYACLDGTFNADEDVNSEGSHSGFGENATECADNIDECDWDYEIAVGRFPVDDTTELSNIVQKTINYMSLNGNSGYLQNITLAGQGGGFGGITEWMCNYSKTLNGTTYNDWKDKDTTHGFDANDWKVKIMDANPDRKEGEPFYDENSRGDFNNGVHIFYESSHGSTSGWAAVGGEGNSFSTSDIQALTNTKYCFVMSAMPCNTATFDESDDPFGEQFVTDEHGAFAYLGNTRYGYGSYEEDGLNSSSHRLGAEVLDAFLNSSEGYSRIGDMVYDAKRDVRHWHDYLGDQAIRYAMYEQILFGSPAVKLQRVNDTSPPEFSNVQATPSVQMIGGYVNISATVIDNINIDEVYLYIEYPESSFKSAKYNYIKKASIMRGYSENFSITQNKTGNSYFCKKKYNSLGTYSYHLWAIDKNKNQNISLNYYFEIIENEAPNTPSDPDPSDGAKEIDINSNISWTCDDPDGDNLTYNVYFEENDPTPDELVSENQTSTTYDPGQMKYNKTYYWQIVAWDIFGLATAGPIWEFTTMSAPNHPPNKPTIFEEDETLYVYTHDLDEDDVMYIIDWGDGTTTETDYYPSGQYVEINHEWSEPGIYYIRAKAKDVHNGESDWSKPFEWKIENNPPETPTITGPNKGRPRIEYTFTFVTDDIDGDEIYYYIDWNDSSFEEWIGPYESGIEVTVNHTWKEKGSYIIKAKAKDTFDYESNWSEFAVEIPRHNNIKSVFIELFEKIIKRFPNILPILRYILGLNL